MSDIKTLLCRDELGPWLNQRGLTGVGLEVGTYKGEFAERILDTWAGALLQTCDPWRVDPAYVDGCIKDWSKEGLPFLDLEAMKAEAEKRLERFGSRVCIQRKTGVALLREFPNAFLDWAYLDGDHSYGVVMEEFELAYAKVKSGGIIGTHDTYNRSDALQHCGVADAVWDFAHKYELRPHTTRCTSTWFRRP
jgi:hypothetical protein